jgi:site-specific DNA-cytosine methylase/site-specific DNA-adenine methylase
MPTTWDLFCGCGGMSLGFEQAGFQCKFAFDWERDQAATFAINRPRVPVLRMDVRQMSFKDIMAIVGRPDVLAGGPPCQGFSSASKPLDDASVRAPKRSIYFHAIRALGEVRPALFFFENSPNVATQYSKPVFAALRRVGRAAKFHILAAKDFNVPQVRRRAFLVDPSIEPPSPSGQIVTPRKAFAGLSKPSEGGRDELHRPRNATPEFTARIARAKPGGFLYQDPRGGKEPWSYTNVRIHPDRPTMSVNSVGDFCHFSQARKLTFREYLRLQCMPDSYKFFFSTPSNMRILVARILPPPFAKAWALQIKQALNRKQKSEYPEITPHELDLILIDFEDECQKIDSRVVSSVPIEIEDVIKLAIAEINPKRLRGLSDEEILSLNRRTHQLYGRFFADSDRTSANGLSREDLINAQVFLVSEMKRRGMRVDLKTALNREVGRLLKDEVFSPPRDVRNAAALGLKLRREFKRGGTTVGVARARDLSTGRSISLTTIARMVSFFARHGGQVDRRDPQWENEKNPSAQWIAWLLWGGDPGRKWADKIWSESKTKATITTPALEDGGLKLPDQGQKATDAIYFVEPHAKWLANGSKTAMVKARPFNIAGKPLFLAGEKIYGVIVFDAPREIDLFEFEALRPKHKITDKEREKWWPRRSRLFAFEVRFFDALPEPKDYVRPRGVQTFINNVRFKATVEKVQLKGRLWGSPGGKGVLAKSLVAMFPKHKTYAEPFAGGAACLYAKERSEVEVLNDIDEEIAFAFKFVRDMTDDQAEKLKRLSGRTITREMIDRVHRMKPKTSVARFFKFLFLRFVHYFRIPTKGIDYDKIGSEISLRQLDNARERLKGVKVYSGDYRKVVEKYDRPDALFFLDPPYTKTSQGVGEKDFDFDAFWKVLRGIKGKFLLTLDAPPPKESGFSVKKLRHNVMKPSGLTEGETFVITNYEVTKAAGKYAVVNPGTEETKTPIELTEVLGHFAKPMALRAPCVYIVGSLPGHGSGSDIDLLIEGPLSSELRQVIEFRLGRALPPALSKRVQFHDESLGGPFTSHVPLYDLVLVPREERAVIEMREEVVEKQDDPLLDHPSEENAICRAVWQLHFRGKSCHADFRMQPDPKFLVGWTIAVQKPGRVPEVDTLEEGRRLTRAFDVKGSAWNKPMVAPAKVYATPKSRQPVEWLRLKDQVIEPGGVGATRFAEGVFVVLERPRVEFGLQKSNFHEYFLSDSKHFNGVIYFRQLVGREGPKGPEEETGKTPPGQTFWTHWLSKEHLPSVLKPRAVETKSMPPDGYSAMPRSLMEQTPEEFRFWEHKGEKAREIRDALVESRHFTPANVELVNGQIRRVERKVMVDGVELEKADETRFTLSWQYWKAQTVVRPSPSREVWHLVLERGDGAEVFTLQRNPMNERKQITAIRGQDRTNELLSFAGAVKPGQRIGGTVRNDTKETPSRIEIVDRGRAVLLEDGSSFKKVQFHGKNLRGVFALEAEQPGAKLWRMSESRGPDTKRDGTQIWNPAKATSRVDRAELRPFALYQPMKPKLEFTDPSEAIKTFGTVEALDQGIFVDPKWNGFRASVQKRGDEVRIITEDVKRDVSRNMPNVRKELASINEDFILDCEITAFDGDAPVPRRELAAFRGKGPRNDSGVRLQCFDVLWLGGNSLVDQHLIKRRPVVERFVERYGKKHLVMSPSKLVKTEDALRSASRWAKSVPGSEGAMFKLAMSTISLGGQTSSWAKLKETRLIKAIIYDRHPVKDSPGVFNFFGAIGPISVEDKDKWKETVEIEGKLYTPIGRTFNSKEKASTGDVIVVEVTELVVDKRKEGAWSITWFTPMVVERVEGRPNTPAEVADLAQQGEVMKRSCATGDVCEEGKCSDTCGWENNLEVTLLPVSKAEEEQRIVFGVVLEPDTVDSQGDTISAEEIIRAARLWLARYQNRGIMHRRIVNSKLELYESYTAPVNFVLNGRKIKKGTWLLMYHVLDDAMWQDIKDGKLTGFSMGGRARRVPTAA